VDSESSNLADSVHDFYFFPGARTRGLASQLRATISSNLRKIIEYGCFWPVIFLVSVLEIHRIGKVSPLDCLKGNWGENQLQAKESITKAVGQGIDFGLERIEVILDAEEGESLLQMLPWFCANGILICSCIGLFVCLFVCLFVLSYSLLLVFYPFSDPGTRPIGFVSNIICKFVVCVPPEFRCCIYMSTNSFGGHPFKFIVWGSSGSHLGEICSLALSWLHSIVMKYHSKQVESMLKFIEYVCCIEDAFGVGQKHCVLLGFMFFSSFQSMNLDTNLTASDDTDTTRIGQ